MSHNSVVRGWVEIAIGLVLIAVGIGVTVGTVTGGSSRYVITYGPVLAGISYVFRGVTRVRDVKGLPFTASRFVALRYLMVAHPKVTRETKQLIAVGLGIRLLCYVLFVAGVGAASWKNPLWDLERVTELFVMMVVVNGVLRYSKPALIAFIFGAAVGCIGYAIYYMSTEHPLAFAHAMISLGIGEDGAKIVAWVILIMMIGGFGIAGLATFFGTLRAFFTFFTTVPIGGVWIGTGALVCVLSVMSGFESDLREKILGSNAHIQITREDGDFTEWHEVKARLDKIPGVVATTPYAVSEVVIAANSNGMNVIIKGIDPQTVGKVTELVHDIDEPAEDAKRDAMKRLEPLVDDPHDLRVPQTTQPRTGVDPPPSDLPTGGDPIDYSQPADDSEPEPDVGSGGSEGSAGSAGSGDFGGDAATIVGNPVMDPPPDDLLATDDPPIDYSDAGSGYVDPSIHVVDVPLEPSLSRRTQALPGILVGRELDKQMHLYTGEEVRIVSPLSDPSNPDATGTPIPFNRDYRVAGKFFTGMYEYDLKYVYVTLDSLDEFLDRGDAVDGIEVRVGSPDDTDAYVLKIGQMLGPQYRVQDWKELNRSLFSALKLEKIAMFLVLGIVILVASFSIVGNLIMVVVEKAREIALLKTLGATDAGVMQVFAIQGLLIGVIGTALGVTTGLLACWAGKRFGIPLDPNVYYIDRMPVHVELNSVIVTALAGVLISIAATFYPALVAARVRPSAGMRH